MLAIHLDIGDIVLEDGRDVDLLWEHEQFCHRSRGAFKLEGEAGVIAAINMMIAGWKGDRLTDLREGALGKDAKMIVSNEVYGDRWQSTESRQPRT